MIASLVKEANFGYAVPARPQAPPSVVLPAPWLGWPCPHPRKGGGGEGLFAMGHALRLPGAEVVASAGEPLGVEVVAAAGEAARS